MSTIKEIEILTIPQSIGTKSDSLEVVSTAGNQTVPITCDCYYDSEKVKGHFTFKVSTESRLDILSWLFFNSPDYVDDLISANKHLGLETFKGFSVPSGTVLRIPIIDGVTKAVFLES